MKELKRNDIVNLIDVRFHSRLASHEYKIRKVNARKIDLSKRADILLKIELIDAYSNNNVELFEYYKRFYLESISIFTDNTFVEPGNSRKKSQEDYINAFVGLFERIKKNGFDFDLGLIPFSGEVPLDGAHRTAIAYLLDSELSVVDIDYDSVDYGISFFYDRGASEKLISTLALLLAKYCEGLRVAIVWPASGFDLNSIVKMFDGTNLFGKELYLTENGVNNLCVNAYKNESWIGNDYNGWQGSWKKSAECYAENATFIILFKPNYSGQDLEIKNKIRNLRAGTKHCIHSTDGKEDTVDIVNCTFSTKSESYLNAISMKELSKLRMYISRNGLENHIVTGSSFMGVLGIRSGNDVDTISLDGTASHNIYSGLFSKSIENLFSIDDCKYKFLGVTFLNLEEVSHFKHRRNENKDIDDVRLVNIFLSSKSRGVVGAFLVSKRMMNQKITKCKRILVRNIIVILKYFSLYDIVRRTYRKIF